MDRRIDVGGCEVYAVGFFRVWLPFSHFGSKGLGDEGKTLIPNEYAFALVRQRGNHCRRKRSG